MEGVCRIKPEYLVELPKKAALVEEEDAEPSSKRAKIDDRNDRDRKKKKQRGQNKSRPLFKENRADKLCRALLDGMPGPCMFPKCEFIHDVAEFFRRKPAELKGECFIYKTCGYCVNGLTCHYAKSHITDEFVNMGVESKESTKMSTFNRIDQDLLNVLRKKKYDFSRSNKIVDKVLKSVNISKNGHEKEPRASSKPEGYVPDFDLIPERKCEKKTIDFSNKLLLSPLTTVGNLPFRRICKEYGADITCGEMACVVPLINGAKQEWALTKRHESEDIFGVQLCGNKANLVSYATQLMDEKFNVDFVDLNIGCPIELIYQQGAGSALIRRQNVLEGIVRSCATILGDKPFTVKTRTGVYADKSVAHELVEKFEKWGASAVTVHGRSREQRYTKNADWAYIEKCAQVPKRIPVVGNGDILSYDDYVESKKTAPHVTSVMIGRGALIKPWIFQEIKEGRSLDLSANERFDMMKRYINYGLEHWGSDTKGVENTRRFFLEWQSFMYRYVPYGLLECPPQKINERPDMYRGRDDLETLLASPNSEDWVKISERLLGPVPEGFTFLPKHKANSFSN